MSTWKSKIIKKQGKRSATKSSIARMYGLMPPSTGWDSAAGRGDPKVVNSQGKRVPA